MAKKPKTDKKPHSNKGKTYKKPGRPSTYDPAFHPERAFKLCLLGCTDTEIAEQFGISEETLNQWKRSHLEISESLHAGRVPADSAVADALRKRALGFEWEEEVATKVKVDKDREEVVITKIKRVVPPDTNAASLWLRNRKSANWQEKSIVQANIIEETDDAKLESKLALLLRKAGIDSPAGGEGAPEGEA